MVTIRALRSLFVKGLEIKAGSTAIVDPLDACMAVATGRAEYLTPEDRRLANKGLIAADEKACPHTSAAGRSWVRKPFEP